MVHVVGSDHPHIRGVLTFSIVSPECHDVELYTVYEQHKTGSAQSLQALYLVTLAYKQ